MLANVSTITTLILENLQVSVVSTWVGMLQEFFSSDVPGPSTFASFGAYAETEEEMIRRSNNGDGAAYAWIVRRYQDLIGRRMLRFSRNRSHIEELVHDTFVEAYFSLGRYRGDAPLEHWLQCIATRVGYRYWKRMRRERSRRQVSISEAGEISKEQTEVGAAVADEEQLNRLLDQLPPRDRLVVSLLYVEGLSVAEAAKHSGWSQAMVKVQAYRARGKLRKLMAEFSPELLADLEGEA